MERYNKILNNSLFNEAINTITKNEKNRIFCRHGMEHCLDVARIAYILSLENNLNISKDIIYSTALLHDIGRAFEGEAHNIKSAEISKTILKDCSFTDNEISEILKAILNHRENNSDINSLSNIIYKADKISRQCYSCKAHSECYWEQDKRNHKIKY